MKIQKIILLFTGVLFGGLLSACGPSAEQQATESSLVITYAVETAMAALTETAAFEPTPTFTISPTPEPIATNTPTVVVETYTPIAVQPATQVVTAAGPALSSCDLGSFVDDLSIPDGTELAPGQAFTKSWRIRNEGTCTWSDQYQMLYFGGEVLSAELAYQLTDHEVAPGQDLDISIEMTAPTAEGSYTMYWIMRNAEGENFGVDAFGGAFYVQIVVSSGTASFTATPTQDITTAVPSETPTETPIPSDTPTP